MSSKDDAEKAPPEGFTAIRSSLGYSNQAIPADRFERAVGQLYRLYEHLGGKWPKKKRSTLAFVGTARYEALADEWLAERELHWAKRGRINRFGYLTAVAVKPVTVTALQRAFPQLSRPEILSLRAESRGASRESVPAPAPTGLPRYRGRRHSLENL